MRLIMLLGAAHGTVVESEEAQILVRVGKVAEKSPRIEFETDYLPLCDFKVLYHEYVLFAHGPEEAYYVPRGFNNLQVIKGLLAAQ